MSVYNYIYREIGENINRLRTARGLSQERLAELVGLTRTSIIHIEKGRQKTPLDKLYHMAEILEVDILEFLPLMKKPKDWREQLASQVDMVSRKRIAEDELGQILNAISQEESTHDKTYSPDRGSQTDS